MDFPAEPYIPLGNVPISDTTGWTALSPTTYTVCPGYALRDSGAALWRDSLHGPYPVVFYTVYARFPFYPIVTHG
jgi:hypothetical protein